MRRLAAVPVFFALRVGSALLLLKLSTTLMPVAGFAAFSQLLLFAGLMNLAAVAGAQNGLIRQAAASDGGEALGRARRAAFCLWGAAAGLIGLAIAVCAPLIAQVLVGDARSWPWVLAVGLASLAAGPGQIWCSLLTGRGRPDHSLAAQALGLVAGTTGAGLAIAARAPALAALAFATGGLVTMIPAFLLAARLRIPRAARAPLRDEACGLLKYSAAVTGAAGFVAVTLFILRSLYRDAFGASELGYWLAANRISDMSTQLIGLFMIQLVAPNLAMSRSEAERRGLLVRFWAFGAGAMALALLIFTLLAGPLVRAFLSDAYLPAVPAIRAYMTGDLFRVWASLAMFAAFAGGRPAAYATIEIVATTLMAATTCVLILAHQPQGPMIGYVSAYGAIAALVTLAFLRRRGALTPSMA